MDKVLLISHMPPPTTGIGSWTRRVLECGIPNFKIGFINSNMIGGRDPFQNTRINIVDEFKRNFIIWEKENNELKTDKNYIVVHTNIPCTILGMLRETISCIIAKRYGCKFIVHCHCTLPNVENSRFKRIVFSTFARFVDGFIVLNTQSLNFVNTYTNKPVKIVPNFVCEYELPMNPQYPISCDMKNVLFVGGVSMDKGCDTIIQAAGNMPNITFHLVGIVSEEIKRIPLPTNVKLYGNRDKDFVRKIMENSDAFIFLSHYFGEGFSVALVEAMSSGLPCIVTDWAANADMIGKNQEGGFVIPQQDIKALQEAIHNLNDCQLRIRMSERNIRVVKENYTSSIVLKQISEFYKTIIES